MKPTLRTVRWLDLLSGKAPQRPNHNLRRRQDLSYKVNVWNEQIIVSSIFISSFNAYPPCSMQHFILQFSHLLTEFSRTSRPLRRSLLSTQKISHGRYIQTRRSARLSSKSNRRRSIFQSSKDLSFKIIDRWLRPLVYGDTDGVKRRLSVFLFNCNFFRTPEKVRCWLIFVLIFRAHTCKIDDGCSFLEEGLKS